MDANNNDTLIDLTTRDIRATIDKELKSFDREGRRELLCALYESIGARICDEFAVERAEREHRLRHFGSMSPAGAALPSKAA
jgi:hypothetical protein